MQTFSSSLFLQSSSSEEETASRYSLQPFRRSGGALKFTLSEDTMATATNDDDDKTHWVEDDSTEPSFVKKKPNNVRLLFLTVLL